MTNWITLKSSATYIGRLGDKEMTWQVTGDAMDGSDGAYTDFWNNLPAQLRTNDVQNTYTTIQLENHIQKNNQGVLVCGSEGEIAPSPQEEDYFPFGAQSFENRRQVWTMKALFGEDQLRQKFAMAFSQILVIDPGILNNRVQTEALVEYFDIFVKNGLENYGNILRRISFNPSMADMLTFRRNKSLWKFWKQGTLNHPDENYARELMQLFTIGLIKLNLDGTPMRDPDFPTRDILTYGTDDIISFARVWTAFDFQPQRGGMENPTDRGNRMDPMRITGTGDRDYFPKRGLDGKFIGNHQPLCDDLPEKSFLKAGAKYRLLDGNRNSPKLQYHLNANWDTESKRLVLNPTSSSLFEELCSSSNGSCTWPAVVTLNTNIACNGAECNASTIRMVQVAPGVLYEYVRPPCVHHSFYEGKKLHASGWQAWGLQMCGNPNIPSGTEKCCGIDAGNYYQWWDNLNKADRPCEYLGEVMTYRANDERCRLLGGYPCDTDTWYATPLSDSDCYNNRRSRRNSNEEENVWHWTTAPCSIKAAVNPNGLMLLHHTSDDPLPTPDYLNSGTSVNYFSVHWETVLGRDELYPNPEDDCGDAPGCTKIPEGDAFNVDICLCDTSVSEQVVFTEMPSSESEILSRLSLAYPFDMYDSNEFELIASNDDISAYRKTSSVTPVEESSIPSICDIRQDVTGSNNLILWNVDAELGTTEGWDVRPGQASSTLSVIEGGYGGSNYAFLVNFTDWDSRRYDKSGLRPTSVPGSCLKDGDLITYEFKVKLLNNTDGSGVHCNIDQSSGNRLDTCPGLAWGEHFNTYLGGGFETAWDSNGWNHFSLTFPLNLGQYNYNRINGDGSIMIVRGMAMGDGHDVVEGPIQQDIDNWEVSMIVDDIRVTVAPGPGEPSVSPSTSSAPSLSPSKSASPSESTSPTNMFDTDTIFKVRDPTGRKSHIYLKNVKSIVNVGGGRYNIVNPTSHYDLADLALRDAYHETFALIDHLLYHKNTPPFISKNLIQHMGISNPSPGYIERVATAFQSGIYIWSNGDNSVTFGDNKWGNLAATAAAILLDREATSEVLTADPSHGGMKEPVYKVLGLMRSMEFTRTSSHKMTEIILRGNLYEKIGQMVYEAPDVFSFFSPLFKPSELAPAGLYSPESQVLSMITSIGTLNGMYSLIKNGLSSNNQGFGSSSTVYGSLAFSPTATPSPSPPPTPQPTTVLCTDLIVNGDFETDSMSPWRNYGWGASYWQQTIISPGHGGPGHAYKAYPGTDYPNHNWKGHWGPYQGITNEDCIKAGTILSIRFKVKMFKYSNNSIGIDACNPTTGSQCPCVRPRKYTASGNQFKELIRGISSWDANDWNTFDAQFTIPDSWGNLTKFEPYFIHNYGSWGDENGKDIVVLFDDISVTAAVAPPPPEPTCPSDPEGVVDELSTLLTSGRLSTENRNIIVEKYRETCKYDSTASAMQIAQQLITSTPEYHTTNLVRKEAGNAPRQVSPATGNLDDAYRAVVYVYLFGGLDSFYMLAPHSSCEIYDEYASVRRSGSTGAALDPGEMLAEPLNVAGQDVCDKFGLHEDMAGIKTMYDNEDLLFFANTGHLSRPVTKSNWKAETRANLFSHFHMQGEAGYVDALRRYAGQGVLGRMLDVLQDKNYSVSGTAVDWRGYAIDGDPSSGRSADVIGNNGPPNFYEGGVVPSDVMTEAEMESFFGAVNGATKPNSGLFSNIWSQRYVDAVSRSADLNDALSGVNPHVNYENNRLGNQLRLVTRMIQAREQRQVNRDVFYCSRGGFDHHSDMKSLLPDLLGEINDAFTTFKENMVTEDVWNDVVIVLVSEFGRTLKPNGGSGTDHAWGGNYFIAGGSVKGGRMLGYYPTGFTDAEDYIIGSGQQSRGRLIPTTSWDSLWHGVSGWMGISDDAGLTQAIPNRGNFGCSIYEASDLFEGITSGTTLAGCSGDQLTLFIPLLMTTVRYLTDEEQFSFCEAIKRVLSANSSNSTYSCFVRDQIVSDGSATTSGRRLSNDTNITLTVVTDIGTDDTNVADQIAESVTTNEAAIISAFNNETDGSSGVQGAQAAVLETSAPSVSNAPSMSAPPSSDPSSSPSTAPSMSAPPSSDPSSSPSTSLKPSSSPSTSSQPSRTPSAETNNNNNNNNDNNSNVASIFSWDILQVGNATVALNDESATEEIVMNYNISLKDRTLTLYQIDCQTELSSDYVRFTDNLTNTSDTHGNLEVKLDIVQQNITSSPIWTTDSSNATGNLAFCLRVDLVLPNDGQSVSFYENKVLVEVDMQAGFSLSVDTSRESATVNNETAQVDYTVWAYQCDPTTTLPMNGAMSQGSILSICVRSNSTDVIIQTVSFLELVQGVPTTQSTTPIDATTGSPNGITNIDCLVPTAPGMCIIRTQMLSLFFNTANPGNIQASGTAILAFGTPASVSTRRLTGSSSNNNNKPAQNTRLLRSGNDLSSSFDVNVRLQAVAPDTDDFDDHQIGYDFSAAASKEVFTMMKVTLAVALVFLLGNVL